MAAAMAGCSRSGKTTQFESKTPKEEPVDSIEMFIEYLNELAAKKVSIHDKHSIDTTEYQKFQQFDFCKFIGYGKVEREPYVLIRDSAEFKIIRRSDDLYNPYHFQNMGDHWYNFKGFDMGYSRFSTTMNGEGPADVHRFVQNGVFIDYVETFIHEQVYVDIRVFYDTKSFLKLKIKSEASKDGVELERSYSKDLLPQIKKLINHLKNLPENKLPDWLRPKLYYTVKQEDNCIKEFYFYYNDLCVDSIPPTPLGEMDDNSTKPRTFANDYAWKL